MIAFLPLLTVYWDKNSCSGRVEIAEFSSRFVELKLGNSKIREQCGKYLASG